MLNKLAKMSELVFGHNSFSDWVHRSEEQQRRQQQILDVCVAAMRGVEYNPNAGFFLADIGVLAYRTRNNPKLIRTTPVLTDTRYLRPFVEIAANRGGNYTVRLEIYDSRNTLLFADEQPYRLKSRSHIVAKSWLPLENRKAPVGKWWVVAYINNMAIGAHPFGWEVIADNDILHDLRTDGEINDDLKRAVVSGKFREMSLDELLADQEE